MDKRTQIPVQSLLVTARSLGFTLIKLFLAGQMLGDDVMDATLANVHSDIRKWATVIQVQNPDNEPSFQVAHYQDSESSNDFWPASTIKLYTVVAVLEWLNSNKLPLDTSLTFSRHDGDRWLIDCARTYPEMVSEVFRRSSNEDYTLLLRTVGIDAINTHFLTPEKGFHHSALMRDYITHRPAVYVNEEPQRIIANTPSGTRLEVEHQWSGSSYSKLVGATALSETTGNCTTTAELADCLKRLLFHSKIAANERFEITAQQARWICEGDPARGIVGLENRLAGPYGWEESGEIVFPEARFFHKSGLISSYVLDVCYLSDHASDNHLILALAAQSGDPQVIRDMALKIYQAAKKGDL